MKRIVRVDMQALTPELVVWNVLTQGWLKKTLLAAVAACVLGGCTKTIEYEEEVALGDPPKNEVIKRREVLELVIDQLTPKWVFRRSELFLFEKPDPVWSDQLWPLYIEKSPDGQSYLLVAGIENSSVCVARGRPTSYYVTIEITRDKAIEIPTPERLEGKTTNLLLRFSRLPEGTRIVTMNEKERLNRMHGGVSERAQKILLSSNYGC